MMLCVVTFFETLIFTCVMWTYPKSALTPISCVQTVALVAYSVQTHKPWECQNLMQVSFKWLIEPHEIGVWHLQRAKTILYSWERKSKKLDPPITPISLAGSICSWGSRNKPSETTSHAVDPSSKSKVCSILFFKKKNTPPKFSTNFLMASQSCRMWFRSKSDPFEPSNRTWATIPSCHEELLGGIPSEKYDFVSWDHELANISPIFNGN